MSIIPLAFLLVPATSATAWPEVSPLDITPLTLSNGLRVVIHADRRAPLIALHVQYAVGAAEDSTAQAGLAHLVEHLMFEGSAHAPDGAYDAWLAEIGGGALERPPTSPSLIAFLCIPFVNVRALAIRCGPKLLIFVGSRTGALTKCFNSGNCLCRSIFGKHFVVRDGSITCSLDTCDIMCACT